MAVKKAKAILEASSANSLDGTNENEGPTKSQKDIPDTGKSTPKRLPQPNLVPISVLKLHIENLKDMQTDAIEVSQEYKFGSAEHLIGAGTSLGYMHAIFWLEKLVQEIEEHGIDLEWYARQEVK